MNVFVSTPLARSSRKRLTSAHLLHWLLIFLDAQDSISPLESRLRVPYIR
jgi:hypothetical protein